MEEQDGIKWSYSSRDDKELEERYEQRAQDSDAFRAGCCFPPHLLMVGNTRHKFFYHDVMIREIRRMNRIPIHVFGYDDVF